MGALLGIFFQLQLLVAVAALLAAGLRLCGRAELFTLSAHTELRLQYFLVIALGCALLLPWLVPDFSSPVRPFARVVHTGAVSAQAIGGTPSLVLGTVTKNSTGLGLGLLGWLAAAEVLLGLFHTLLDYLRLLRVISRAVVFRKLGRVRIAVLDGISTPFSARLFHFAWVVLPANSLGKSTLRLALAHELQHHRAGDTVFCHLLAPLRVLCYLHPLRPLWCSVLAEIQELACDEALVSSQTKKWISVRNYSECLVHAAETAVKEKAGRAYAAAPALFSDRRLLKRRSEKMQHNQ